MLKTHSDPIFIIDDQPYLAEMLEDTLINCGYTNVTVFTDPNEALQAIKNGVEPTLIITDYHMPGIDGIELLQRIEEYLPEIDGIIITAHAYKVRTFTQKYRVVSKEFGCSDVVINCLHDKMVLNNV